MNELFENNEVFARKLAEIPVPDIADTIWENIKSELGKPVENANNNPKRKRSMNAAFMVTIIITVCLILFLLFFKRKKPQQNSKIIPSVTHKKDSATKQDTAAIKNFVPADPKRPNKIIPENKKSEKVNFTPPDSINVEEKVKQEKEKTEIKKNDSLTVKKPALPVLKPAKSKGVEGISDSDYRINIKNDSLKKK